jgi:tetratricopeptide (TPR) repeat protein
MASRNRPPASPQQQLKELVKLKDPEERAERLVELARRNATNARMLDDIGQFLDEDSCDDEAVLVLSMARRAGSTDANTLWALGRLLVVKGEIDEGRKLLEAASVDDSDWAAPRIELALLKLETDPEAGLALLADLDDEEEPYVAEARGVLLAALGRTRDAEAAFRDAVDLSDDEVEAERGFASWLGERGHFQAALRHARRLLELHPKIARDADAETVEDVEDVVVETHRLAGRFAELVPWIVERCKDEVPAHLAYDVYFGLTALHPVAHPDLARSAARVMRLAAEDEEESEEVTRWTIAEARVDGLAGNPGPLRGLAGTLDDDDGAAMWLELAAAFEDVRLPDDARKVRARAVRLAPDDEETLHARFDEAMDHGEAKLALDLAKKTAEAPEDVHRAEEQLARILARAPTSESSVDEAVIHGVRSTRLSPWCPNAWCARAEALVARGSAQDLEEARACVDRSLALATPRSLDDDTALLDAVLSRDTAAVDEALKRAPWTAGFPAWAERLKTLVRRPR